MRILILSLTLVLFGCTSTISVHDCVKEMDSDEVRIYKITSVVDGNYYGYLYINGELTAETVELDMTERYKKVSCPN